MSVLVLVEPGEELSLQAVSLARDLGGPVHALAVGEGVTELGRTAWRPCTSARTIGSGPTPRRRGRPASTSSIDRIEADAVVAAGTNRGNEVLAHLAARRDLPFAANCSRRRE